MFIIDRKLLYKSLNFWTVLFKERFPWDYPFCTSYESDTDGLLFLYIFSKVFIELTTLEDIVPSPEQSVDMLIFIMKLKSL